MKFEWKNIDESGYKIIDEWLSKKDRHNLCMENKGWKQTADDIDECLQTMENSQFKNVLGFVNDMPVVAIMFGIEQIKVLNLYNIVVAPKFRNLGIAKNVILKLLDNDEKLNLVKDYQKVTISTLPDNQKMHKLLEELGFENLGFNGDYVVFEKERPFELEKN